MAADDIRRKEHPARNREDGAEAGVLGLPSSVRSSIFAMKPQTEAREYSTDSLHAWMRNLPDEVPTPAEQNRLAKAAAAGDAEARNQLVSKNLRLVYWVAQRYAWAGVPIVDLVQEGAIGLIRAAEKFDPERGFAFSTYATHWVRQAVQRAVFNHCRVVRLPVHVHSELVTLRKARERLDRQGLADPEPDDLAAATGFPLKKVQRLLEAEPTELSLDVPMADEGTPFSETLEAPPDDREELETQRLRGVLDAALERLTEKQRLVLELRNGLGEFDPMTLEEVGQVIGVTRERVRQIQDTAYRILREESPELLAEIAA
jgi:RNA polymerase sigma factor (sigma-70 family)